MNVAVKTYDPIAWSSGYLSSLLLATKKQVLCGVLFAFVVLSALLLVYIKDVNRCRMANLQIAHTHNAQLRNRESQLLLEETSWSAASRMHQIAAQKLGMIIPKAKSVVLVNDS